MKDRLQIALEMGTVTLTLTSAEFAGLGQLLVTLANMGFLGEEHSNNAGKAIFEQGLFECKKFGVNVKSGQSSEDVIQKMIEAGADNSEVSITLTVAGITAVTGAAVPLLQAIDTIGGPTARGFHKMLKQAKELAIEIGKRSQDVNYLDALRPKIGEA
jgi:hypothetical protein